MLSFGSTIHEDSGEGMKSELDLFSVPFTVQQVEAGSYIYIQPIAPVQMACLEAVINILTYRKLY